MRILEAVVADPSLRVGDIDLLGADERVRVLERWNDTSRPVPESTLLDRFDAQVAASPDAVAVVFEGESLTYARVRCAGQSACAVSDLAGRGSGDDGRVGGAPVVGSVGGDVCDRAGGWCLCADRSGSAGRA